LMECLTGPAQIRVSRKQKEMIKKGIILPAEHVDTVCNSITELFPF
jgi:hypothetical protein